MLQPRYSATPAILLEKTEDFPLCNHSLSSAEPPFEQDSAEPHLSRRRQNHSCVAVKAYTPEFFREGDRGPPDFFFVFVSLEGVAVAAERRLRGKLRQREDCWRVLQLYSSFYRILLWLGRTRYLESFVAEDRLEPSRSSFFPNDLVVAAGRRTPFGCVDGVPRIH